MSNLPLHALHKSSLGPVPAKPNQFVSPLIDEAFLHWHDLRGSESYPLLRDLKSNSPTKYSPYAAVLDVASGDYHVRFLGPTLVRTYGELTGKYISDLQSPLRERIFNLLDTCVEEQSPVYSFWPRSAIRGEPFIGVEVISLPMSKLGDNLDHIVLLSVQAFDSPLVPV